MSMVKSMVILALGALCLGGFLGLGFVAPRTASPSPATAATVASPSASIHPGEASKFTTGAAVWPAVAMVATAVGLLARSKRSKIATRSEALHGISFSYSMQKDAYADYEFLNDVGYLPDGTPLNRAGNCINHPETIGPDPHTPGSPLSYYAAEVGYLVDGTDMLRAGNLSVQGGAAPPAATPATPAPVPVAAAFVGSSAQTSPVRHSIGFAYAVQKDAYVDLTFGNDVGYLPDGTPMNRAGNCINHPETIGPDPHAPGSPLPRALFVNDVGYLPDGTPMNKAGNCINHPETIGPDPHSPGSALPPSAYAADVGYLVDGTPLDAAGNNAVH